MRRHRPTGPNFGRLGTFRASAISKDHLPIRSEESDVNPKLRVLAAVLGTSFVLVTATACGSGSGAVSAGTAADTVAAGDRALSEDIAAAKAGIDPTSPKAEEQLAKEGGYGLEGSVTTKDGKFVQYPDGFRITFLKAENRPDAQSPYADRVNKHRVRFTLLLENTGTSAVMIDPQTMALDSTGGVNRFDLEHAPDSYGSEAESDAQPPQRLSPGTSFTIYENFEVPQDKRDAITVTVNSPDSMAFTAADGSKYTPFTFLDVQTLLAK